MDDGEPEYVADGKSDDSQADSMSNEPIRTPVFVRLPVTDDPNEVPQPIEMEPEQIISVKKMTALPSSTPSTFGILDIEPNGLIVPPVFSEPETIQAMNQLGIAPSDLVLLNQSEFDTIPGNNEIRMKVLLELDKRRMKMIADIINQRNKIIQGIVDEPDTLPPEILDGPKRKKKKGKGKKRKKGKKKGKSKKSIAEDTDAPSETSFADRPPMVSIRRKKKKVVKPTAEEIRRLRIDEQMEAQQKKLAAQFAKKQKDIDERVEQVELEKRRKIKEMKKKRLEQKAKIENQKKKQEEETKKKAQKTLLKLDKVEQRKERMKKEQMAKIKQRAAERERRLKNAEREKQKKAEQKRKKIEAEMKKEDRQSKLAMENKTKKLTISQRKKMRAKIIVPTVFPKRKIPNEDED